MSRRVLGLALFLSVTIAAFETTAVITALPTISDLLDGSGLYGAALSANLLTSIVAIVAFGEVADGRRLGGLFLVAIGLFVVGLVIAGVAQSMPAVVAGRGVQGLGAGGMATLPYVTIRRGVPERSQPAMYALLSAGWVLPSLIAPAVAGWLTDTYGWRWVFLGLAGPSACVAVLVAVQVHSLPDPAPAERSAGTGPGASRIPSAVALTIGSALTLAGLAQSHLIPAIGLVGGGLAVAARPVRRLWPSGWTRARAGLPAAVAARMCATAAFSGVDGFVPLAADRIHHVGPTAQGFTIIGAALTWTLGQVYAARQDTSASVRLVRAGFVAMAIGAVLVMPVVLASTPLWMTFVGWAVGGLGMGLLFNPTTVVGLSSVGEEQAGRASSQLSVGDQLGFASTAAVGGALVGLADRGHLTLSHALVLSFAVSAGLALVGVVAAGGVRLGSAGAAAG